MNRIKELREDKDLLQSDICKVLNVSQQQYSRYEQETSLMSYDQLIALADFYHVSIDYILYNTDKREPYPKSMVTNREDSKRNRILYDWKEEVKNR